MYKIVISTILGIGFLISVTSAQTVQFESTSEGIVKGLTRSWKKPPTGMSGPLPSDTLDTGKTRKIIVVKKKGGKDIQEEISLPEYQNAPSVNLKVLFDYDSYQIRPSTYGLLEELGKALTSEALKDKRIVIKGHTDSDGSNAYNLKLSLNRALAVKNYLIGSFRITDNRLNVSGYGEALPLVPNISVANKRINRRVEVQAE